jgi:hypothetical protein
MENIILDGETYEPIDELAERNERIKASLEPTLTRFLAEKKTTENLKKPQKLGYRFTKQLYLAFSKNPPEHIDFLTIDYDTLNELWLKFQELTAFYNEHFEIIDNKQLFMAFCKMTSRQYEMLERSDNDDISGLMDMINNEFVGLAFIASESGNADAKAVSTRLRAKDVGHDVISASEDKLIEKAEGKSPLELERQLAAIMGGSAKLIGGK